MNPMQAPNTGVGKRLATGFICSSKIYRFEGWVFEDHYWCGPWPMKKDGDPRKRAGEKFYAMYERFRKLPDTEKKACRIGGGCVPF